MDKNLLWLSKGDGMMERLTIDEVIEHCNKTCDMTEKIAKARGHELKSIESNQFWEHYQVRAWLKELKQYKNLEEQGLLLRFPCGIGDDVYFIPSKTNYKLNILHGHPESNRVYHQNVERITFTTNGWYLECDKDLEYSTDHILIDKLYKETWFLSQAEAEQKLKEMERD